MNPVQNWKKFVAVGCTHAHLINARAEAEFFEFVEAFKPDRRIHLGDVWDTQCWRGGAGNGPDSGKSITEDFKSGEDFLLNYRPHTVFLGNHDVRPFENLEHPNAIVRHAAKVHVEAITDFITKDLRAEMVDYDVRRGWRILGGAAFGHGYMHNEQAARDHAEMLGRPTVIAHVHTLASASGRSYNAPTGWTAGCLIDIDKARYASRRRATHRWRNGWVYGEYSDTDCRIFPHYAATERLDFLPMKLPEIAEAQPQVNHATF